MNWMKIFRRKKVKSEIPIQVPEKPTMPDIELINKRHSLRIGNLMEEYEMLAYDLRKIESDESVTRSEREKQTDKIIRRMTLIKYEADIRKGLING